jgi:hypothetical protein
MPAAHLDIHMICVVPCTYANGRYSVQPSGCGMWSRFVVFLLELFGSRPLLFFRVGETSLLFMYFEICHYNF